MVRPMLSAEERARGRRLGALLRSARADRSMVEVAAASGVPVETLRKIETGRIPTPAFFTVAALAAIKRLQAEGRTLAEVQRELVGATTATLERIARLPDELPDGLADREPAAGDVPARTRFWSQLPAEPADPPAAADGVGPVHGV